MTGLLVTGGEGPALEYLRPYFTSSTYIVAADSGIERLHMFGIEPDLIIGDMDSISDLSLLDSYPQDIIRRFPRDKDETDTEIGLRLLQDAGHNRVIIAGGGGGRLDHVLGMLSLFERERPPAIWLTAAEEVILIETELQMKGLKGERVSFFPVGNDISTMSTTGLKWPLDHLKWRHGDAGISNVVNGDLLAVRMKTGKLIMIRELKTGGVR